MLAGCSAGPAPLSAAPPGDAVCYASSPHAKMTYGIEDFTNHSRQAVVFDRVGLRDPLHLKVLGAYISPRTHSTMAGVVSGWPPPPQPGPTEWALRRPVRGYRLPAGAAVAITLGFQLTAPSGGRSPGMLIWYHTSDGSYVLRDDLAILVARVGGACPNSPG
ncbi:MAG: hypothetical protein ACYCU3_00585 [Streptosporangiaceae bacterium]